MSDSVRIYAIADEGRGLVKIGISKNPEYRCEQLNGAAAMLGYDGTLRLVGSAPIELTCFERLVHLALGNVRRKGEWFVADDQDVRDFIDRVIVLNANGRHGMRPATWLYRRGLLGESWKPVGAESNGDASVRQQFEAAAERREVRESEANV